MIVFKGFIMCEFDTNNVTALQEAERFFYDECYLLYEGEFMGAATVKDHVRVLELRTELLAEHFYLRATEIQLAAYNNACADFHEHN